MGPSQLNITIELVHKLCCDIPEWGFKNMMTIANWLESKANEVLTVILLQF